MESTSGRWGGGGVVGREVWGSEKGGEVIVEEGYRELVISKL